MTRGLRYKANQALNPIKAMMKVGNYWYWLPPDEVPDEIPIRPLVFPLRYDILIRRSYFDFYSENRELYRTDFSRYLAKACGHQYFEWFTKVLMVRSERASIGNREKTLALFAERLQGAADLHNSFESKGFNLAHPIIPYTGLEILPADSGVVTGEKYFVGDGCHRLACLMSLGYQSLPRKFLQIKCFRKLTPLDNTSLLKDHLEIRWPKTLAGEGFE